MDRIGRGLSHAKQEKVKSMISPPVRGQGRDGDMAMYNGHLFIKDKNEWHEFVSKSQYKEVINKILIGDNDEAVQLELKYDGVPAVVQDLHTLMAKINKIISLLKLDVK